ncbi:site-specific DNA-methyltransferase [Curtobacterium sp. S6]|uniref:site-specific DNA-methyltransferase n=1 Tax=Curtobacterium sp. S6 TaxID=1479623 RepID=UPI0006924568|nr:site-specific DNA-methyltransferase [Curtobacterium sp. S6]
MDKLKMHSTDLTQRNVDAVAELFPSVVTEAFDANGKPVRAVDFDILRQELSDHIVEGPQERYQLDWPGKRAAAFAANTPIARTLRPVRDESVDFDTTRNLFIEGDNLEALKLLQESYLGKVKLIYIDPPYNTGNDFVYEDDFAESTADYLERSGQATDSGYRLTANPDSAGRYHSNWLSMMYPRLKLARNLLAEDGLIFISIDAHEVHNVIKICDEIFGAGSHKNTIAVRRGIKNVQAQFEDVSALSQGHEYVLLYARSEAVRLPKLSLAHVESKPGKWDTFWRGTDRPTMRYELFGSTPASGQWRWEEGRTKQAAQNYETYLAEQSDSTSLDDYYLNHLAATNVKLNFIRLNTENVVQYYVPPSGGKLLSDNWMDLTLSGNETDEFDTEKSVALLSRIIGWVTGDGDIVMDFFAGSGTTGQAIFSVNAADGGNRRFILVQLPERIAGREGTSIAAITRDRLKKAGTRYAAADADTGLRALRVDSTNMLETFAPADALAQGDLLGGIDSVKPDRTDEDLLFQVLLDWGLDLAEPIAVEEAAGQRIVSVADDALIACLSNEVTGAVVAEIARRHPLRAVFLDAGFASDAARINAEQIFREVSPATQVRTI